MFGKAEARALKHHAEMPGESSWAAGGTVPGPDTNPPGSTVLLNPNPQITHPECIVPECRG